MKSFSDISALVKYQSSCNNYCYYAIWCYCFKDFINLHPDSKLFRKQYCDIYHYCEYLLDSVFNQTGATVSFSTDSNNSTLIVTVQANTSSSARTTTITITGNGTTNQTITITQNGSYNGIYDMSENNFVIYQNPSNGIMQFTFDPGLKMDQKIQVSVKGLSGRTVYQNLFYATVKQIDLSSFNKGLYFISVKVKDQIITKKVVIE
jgi:hypothetical protein